MADKKWRELTSIEDYEFDPDGKYDTSLTSDVWDEIFTELYQRAETTEEYLNNPWTDPISTRNAYTYPVKKNGADYLVLKYYDGMYALYEIRDAADVVESNSKTSQVIARLNEGVSVRVAISEALNGQKRMFEAVAGMDKESYDEFLAKLDKWTGGSGNAGWEYSTKESGDIYTVSLTKNPIAEFEEPVSLDANGNVLNGEIYYKPTDEYFAASGPVSMAGLKSVLRDLQSQVEMADSEEASDESNENIYGY